MADTKISALTEATTIADTDELPIVTDTGTVPVTKRTFATTLAAYILAYIHSLTGKTTPVDADELALIDSAAANVAKKLTWANLKATLKTYFDTLYYTAAQSTYTPVLTNTTNVAASTAAVCMYFRSGNVVTVAGTVEIDPTTTGNTVLGMSLPIASNIAAIGDIGGVATCGGAAGSVFSITGDATNDRATFTAQVTDTSNRIFSFVFSYLVR